MRKNLSALVTIIMIIVALSFHASSAHAFTGGIAADWNSSSSRTSVTTPKQPQNHNKTDLEKLYDEFHKFWYVRDSYDLQDRFEEFLKSKHIDPEDIDGYDDFMETWVDHYDEDLDFDDLCEVYDLDPDDIDDPDEYDVLLDDDVDELYDDYLDDYIDEGYYEDYGEYFDEVYYD